MSFKLKGINRNDVLNFQILKFEISYEISNFTDRYLMRLAQAIIACFISNSAE
jgi:hypothetical protein